MALDTRNIGERTSKVLEPGNHIVEILSVSLDKVPFKAGAYHLSLHCQGPDLGADFIGFFIDPKDESKGRYKGQAGRIRTNEWYYSDGKTKSGIDKYRDKEIMKAIHNICYAIGQPTWVKNKHGKCKDIEDFIAQFNNEKLFKGKLLRMCVAGREYTNKQGYKNYDLFIAKGGRGTYGFESVQIPESHSKVVKFDPAIHIKLEEEKKSNTVASFSSEKPVTEATKNQFSLE